MKRIEIDIIKERLLTEFYNKAGLTPSEKELDASHEAFSDELVEKLNEWAKKELAK